MTHYVVLICHWAGRCEGGWIAPYWCEDLWPYYSVPCPLRKLSPPTIAGIGPSAVGVQARSDIAKEVKVCPYVGNICHLTKKDLKRMKEKDLATHIAQV
jgi:hypothetical protein